MTEAAHDVTGRYTPDPDHPGEWVCRDCTPPTGRRVVDTRIHDGWHADGAP